jgi:hypothetical protein
MAFTNLGRNKVRDLLRATLNEGTLGEDGTPASKNDTALGDPDASTTKSVTTNVQDRRIIVDYNLPATDGNGVTFREIGLFDDDGTMIGRHVFSALTKSSSDQWQITTIYNIR